MVNLGKVISSRIKKDKSRGIQSHSEIMMNTEDQTWAVMSLVRGLLRFEFFEFPKKEQFYYFIQTSNVVDKSFCRVHGDVNNWGPGILVL
jgi:hypothetical protein